MSTDSTASQDQSTEFTCQICGQVRDEDIDGGLVIRWTSEDGTEVKVLTAICAATAECSNALVATTDELFAALARG